MNIDSMKEDKIKMLKRYVKAEEKSAQEYREEIAMLEGLVSKEKVRQFERAFWRLSIEERTNVKISEMLNELLERGE